MISFQGNISVCRQTYMQMWRSKVGVTAYEVVSADRHVLGAMHKHRRIRHEIVGEVVVGYVKGTSHVHQA